MAAGALRDTFSEHTLRSAFASGLDAALVTAGCAGLVAAALVLVLVRTPRVAVVGTAAGGRDRAAEGRGGPPAVTEPSPVVSAAGVAWRGP